MENATSVALDDKTYNAYNATAPIRQYWGNIEWKMGENGEKPYDPNFILLHADYTEKIWARATFEGAPLQGHTMKFVADHLVVREKDVNGQVVLKTFTTDPKETGTDLIYQENIDALVAKYLILPTATEAGDGIFKGQLTIKKSADFIVESYKLALEDQGVYQKKN